DRIFLDFAPPPLVCMEPDAHPCETRNPGRLASCWLSFVLALLLSGWESWQAKDQCRGSIGHPADGEGAFHPRLPGAPPDISSPDSSPPRGPAIRDVTRGPTFSRAFSPISTGSPGWSVSSNLIDSSNIASALCIIVRLISFRVFSTSAELQPKREAICDSGQP